MHEKKMFIVHHVTLLGCHAKLKLPYFMSQYPEEVFVSFMEYSGYHYLVCEPLTKHFAKRPPDPQCAPFALHPRANPSCGLHHIFPLGARA